MWRCNILSNWQCNFSSGVCYLDHAGATLYAESQIKAIAEDLCENVYGNPHSLSTSSRYSTDVIDQIRYRCVIRPPLITVGFWELGPFNCSVYYISDVSTFQVSNISLVHKKHLNNTSVNNVLNPLNRTSVAYS